MAAVLDRLRAGCGGGASITDIADAADVTDQGAAGNINEPVAQGVTEEVEGRYPKLIRFPGMMEALRVG